MSPLWFLRYAYFLQALNDTKLQVKNASINLESYVAECQNLKDRDQLDKILFTLAPNDQAVTTTQNDTSECSLQGEFNAGGWCAYGICLMEQLPDEMLEHVIVLTTIFVRW